MNWILTATFAVCVIVSVGSTIVPGRCPVVSVKDGFDVTKYVGTWYSIRSYLAIFQLGINCSRANYTLAPKNRILVNNTGTMFDRNGKRVAVNATGYAVAPNPSIPAKLVVHFDFPNNSTGDYWVVDTDYSTYSIVWACRNIAAGLFHEVHAWILGRSNNGFNGDTEATIDRSLSTHNIDPTLFYNETQTNCTNY